MFVYELIILHVCLCMTLHTSAYGNFIYVDHVGIKFIWEFTGLHMASVSKKSKLHAANLEGIKYHHHRWMCLVAKCACNSSQYYY